MLVQATVSPDDVVFKKREHLAFLNARVVACFRLPNRAWRFDPLVRIDRPNVLGVATERLWELLDAREPGR